MALSTDDPTLATTTQPGPTTKPVTDPPLPRHGRRNAIVGWAGVGLAVAAVAALAVAVLRPETSTPIDHNSRTVAQHGSVNAIDHHDELINAARANSVSRTVAEHGSVNAIDHQDELINAARASSVSRTVAEHGSVSAIDHRDQTDHGAPTASTGR